MIVKGCWLLYEMDWVDECLLRTGATWGLLYALQLVRATAGLCYSRTVAPGCCRLNEGS